MQSYLLKNKKKISFWEGIKTLENTTQFSYRTAVKHFDSFCFVKYNRTINDIVSELKTLQYEDIHTAFSGLLQDFIHYLEKYGLANQTIYNYCQITIYYFGHNGIRVHSSDLRRSIRFPKIVKEKRHPLTINEIHQLFRHTPTKRKMLYLLLIGSGMRIRETTCLRKKDFDFDQKRIKIEIPAQFTKTKTAHTSFVSKQAEKQLRPHLESLRNNDLVFATNENNPYNAGMTEIEAFTRYRNNSGLTEKYDTTNRHLITLHSFRSYFFVRARRIHDTDIAHGMIGHNAYLPIYDRKDDDEKLELYLKVEPSLRIKL